MSFNMFIKLFGNYIKESKERDQQIGASSINIYSSYLDRFCCTSVYGLVITFKIENPNKLNDLLGYNWYIHQHENKESLGNGSNATHVIFSSLNQNEKIKLAYNITKLQLSINADVIRINI